MQKSFNSLLKRLGSYFMGGLLAILPIVLTVAIVIWVAGFVEGFVGPNTFIGRSLEALGLQFVSNRVVANLIGWAIVLGVVFLLGVFVEMGAKRILRGLVDGVLNRIPIVGNVYSTSRQFVDMLDKKDQSELKAMSVVFCTFGTAGGPSVLALMPSPEQFHIDGQDYHVVIIPTAPVPVGGGLIFMPVNSVRQAEISVDALMSIYVSMGVTTPQYISPPKSAS